MKMIQARDPERHDEIWLLLPWYVNETLDQLGCARVRRHLQMCSECREEVTAQRALRCQLQSSIATGPAMGPALERFQARLRADAPPQAAGTGGEIRVFAKTRQPGPTRRRRAPALWAAAAAGLFAALVLPSLPGIGPITPDHLFHTAASPESYSQFDARDVRVVFAKPMSEGAIGAILTPLQGRIVDGPGQTGIYTVRFEAEDVSRESVEQRLRSLRANRDVALAELAIPVSEPIR